MLLTIFIGWKKVVNKTVVRLRVKIKTNGLYLTKLFLYGQQVHLICDKCDNLLHSYFSIYFLS